VTETILQQDDLKKRANVVKHFIMVAEVRFLPFFPRLDPLTHSSLSSAASR
jgi:hypothetical protein